MSAILFLCVSSVLLRTVKLTEIDMAKATTNNEIEEAVARNDEEWEKRLLLMVMIMLIAILGLD